MLRMNPMALPLVLHLAAPDTSSSAIVGWEAIDEWAMVNVESWRAISEGCGRATCNLQYRACALAVGLLAELHAATTEIDKYRRAFGPFLVDLPTPEAGAIENAGSPAATFPA